MALSAGTKLGPYEIVSLLGSGGMGEVYRARDPKLGREVAIKILSDPFVTDPERVARFQREAHLLAALNHPHIAGIHSLEEANGSRFLVLELVEGETLAQRLTLGPLPLNEVLGIARQVTDALEAAHEKGITHRDLKPANIALTADGQVKVLDFGLAKATGPDLPSDVSKSPTLTLGATQGGVILGTAAYMSPEQAKGRAADKRSDVWAFGCVLFELLAGTRAFGGEDVSDTLAAVLRGEPEWTALPTDVPMPIRTLIKRCLEKDRRGRIPDMSVVRFLLEDASTAAVTSAGPVGVSVQPAGWRRALPWAVAVAALATASVQLLPWTPWRAAPPVASLVRFPIVLPEDHQFTRSSEREVALSPDGTKLVYAANRQLYLRSLADMEVRPIPGTGLDAASPFFSPDGQWIGFAAWQDATLKKIAVTGGAPVTLCKAEVPFSPVWEGDQILYAQFGKGILRVSANGGEPETLVRVSPQETAFGAQMLDGGRALLFTVTSATAVDRWDQAQIVVQPLGSGQRKVIPRGGSDARYLPTGHIVYALGATLLAVRFDVKTLDVRGGPVPVLEGVSRTTQPIVRAGVAQVALSGNGSLAYVPGTALGTIALTRLALVGRDGRVQPLELAPQPYIHPRLSPDGSQLAVATDDGREANIWVYDVKARASLRRLTFGGRNLFPIWTPDGRYITFQSDREGDRAIFWQLADGSGPAERLTRPDKGTGHEPESWSPDRRTLTLDLQRGTLQGVWTMSQEGDRKPKMFADSSAVEKHSVFSPDGRWLAYMSTTGSGYADPEVFVQPFPPTGATYQISTGGGRTPLWSPDGKYLFYHHLGSNRLFAVDVRTTPSFAIGRPAPLPIEGTIHPQAQRNYDITPNGMQFVVALPATGEQTDSSRRPMRQINVVLNWLEELKARVPAK